MWGSYHRLLQCEKEPKLLGKSFPNYYSDTQGSSGFMYYLTLNFHPETITPMSNETFLVGTETRGPHPHVAEEDMYVQSYPRKEVRCVTGKGQYVRLVEKGKRPHNGHCYDVLFFFSTRRRTSSSFTFFFFFFFCSNHPCLTFSVFCTLWMVGFSWINWVSRNCAFQLVSCPGWDLNL